MVPTYFGRLQDQMLVFTSNEYQSIPFLIHEKPPSPIHRITPEVCHTLLHLFCSFSQPPFCSLNALAEGRYFRFPVLYQGRTHHKDGG